MGIAIGFGLGILVGGAGAAVLMRWSLGLGERIVWGAKEGRPALSDYDDPPVLQGHTGDLEEDWEMEP